MAGYGVKEARINRERKPRVNTCGSCAAECNSLLCDECLSDIAEGGATKYGRENWLPAEDEVNHETRVRG